MENKATQQEIVEAISDAWHKQNKVDAPFESFRAGFIAGLQWMTKKMMKGE